MLGSRTRISIIALTASLVAAAGANAQATRTWVSGVGNDANPCSRTAPCKTFAGAISKTAAGGEISTLDPGGFGAVTITKSITISGDGTLSGILASLVNGVIVNAGANDKVILRNLSINGAGNGINGIRYLAGSELVVENVTIDGFSTNCIEASLGANVGFLYVRDSRLTRCTTGLRLAATTGFVAATLDKVRIYQGTNGVDVAAGGRLTMRDSVSSGNSTNGVQLTGANAVANLTNNLLAFNSGNGVTLNTSGAQARVSRNAFFNNQTAWAIGAGTTLSSDGDNVFGGNVSDGPLPNGAALVEK
jgi:hypothetical protein